MNGKEGDIKLVGVEMEYEREIRKNVINYEISVQMVSYAYRAVLEY